MSSLVDRFETVVKNNLKLHLRTGELSVQLYAAKKELAELKAKAKIKYKRRLALEERVISLNNDLMKAKAEIFVIKKSSDFKSKFENLEAKAISDREFFEAKIARLEAQLNPVIETELSNQDTLKAKSILDKISKDFFSDEHAINLLMLNVKPDEKYVTRLLNSWKYFNVK